LLFAGTEFAAFASINRGLSWTKINNNLPTVAIHEFAIHPTAGEMVIATHGRSLWVVDISGLRQIKAATLTATAQLMKPTTAIRWRPEPSRGRTNRRFVGENPPDGVQLFYLLGKKAEKASLKIVDPEGKTVRTLTASREPGLHRMVWNLRRAPERQPGAGGPGAGAAGGRVRAGGGAETPQQPPGSGGPPGGATGGRGGGGFGGFGGGRAPAVAPGDYRVVLVVDGQEFAQALRVEADPTAPNGDVIADEEEIDQGDDDELGAGDH